MSEIKNQEELNGNGYKEDRNVVLSYCKQIISPQPKTWILPLPLLPHLLAESS